MGPRSYDMVADTKSPYLIVQMAKADGIFHGMCVWMILWLLQLKAATVSDPVVNRQKVT